MLQGLIQPGLKGWIREGAMEMKGQEHKRDPGGKRELGGGTHDTQWRGGSTGKGRGRDGSQASGSLRAAEERELRWGAVLK